MGVIIEFNAARHTYVVDGVPCPSVTQVLEPEQMLDGIPAVVLERKRLFGQHVHEAAAMLVRGELDWQRLDPALVVPMEGVRNFIRHSGFIVVASEFRVGCPRLRVAGTMDLRGIWKRREALVDWKSTSTLSRTVGPQTAAYDKLYRQSRGGPAHRRYCVLLGEQFPLGFQAHALDDPADWNIFQSCLNLYHWRPRDVAA